MSNATVTTAWAVRYMYLDAYEDAWLLSHEEQYPTYDAALAAAHSWDGTVCPTDNPVVSVDLEIVPA